MRGQDVGEVIAICDISMVVGQGGKRVDNQIVNMTPQGAHHHHNMPRVVNHGCFLIFVESCGQVPGQGFRGQMELLENLTIPFVKGWSPHIR